VCWIGNTDLQAAQGDAAAGEGPIGQALRKREFDQVVLLSNYPAKDNASYVRWAKQLTSASISLREVELEDPTAFAAIYKLADAELGALRAAHAKKKQPLELTLHVSPGTPMMGAAWIILGKTKYPAELIQTSKQKGLKTASIPLDIAAEFVELIPELLRKPDAALEARSTGTSQTAPLFGDILYRCAAMDEVVGRAKLVAARRISVLLEGESGTGKELFARAIHASGGRKGRFVPVNCGALPKDLVESLLFGHAKGAFTGAGAASLGCFREAEGGTLFLDEVGELPLDAQVKLLRALQGKAVTPVGEARSYNVDVRVIAATNRSLTEECRAGRFREDLFYRLAVAVLRLPPLRDRKGDLQPLIEHLLAKANDAGVAEEPGYQRKTLSPGARNLLLNHHWPGNVRELENTLMRATVWTASDTITPADLRAAMLDSAAPTSVVPRLAELGNGFSLDQTLAELSRAYIKEALLLAPDNKSRAAELLGLNSRQTLNNRMKSLGLATGEG
jgi:DNA-binding NtrC family response regulator